MLLQKIEAKAQSISVSASLPILKDRRQLSSLPPKYESKTEPLGFTLLVIPVKDHIVSFQKQPGFQCPRQFASGEGYALCYCRVTVAVVGSSSLCF